LSSSAAAVRPSTKDATRPQQQQQTAVKYVEAATGGPAAAAPAGDASAAASKAHAPAAAAAASKLPQGQSQESKSTAVDQGLQNPGDYWDGPGGCWDSEAEEEAFLRSLGWTSSSEDEGDGACSWGLTKEEIAAFQAEAAARRAQQQQQQPGGVTAATTAVGVASVAVSKLGYQVPGSLPGLGGVLYDSLSSSSSPAGQQGGIGGFPGALAPTGFSNGLGAGFRDGQGWSQHQSLPNVCVGGGPVLLGQQMRGMGPGAHMHWPAAVAAARIFGGGSSSGEESGSESDSG
jgi:hypothetical protein